MTKRSPTSAGDLDGAVEVFERTLGVPVERRLPRAYSNQASIDGAVLRGAPGDGGETAFVVSAIGECEGDAEVGVVDVEVVAVPRRHLLCLSRHGEAVGEPALVRGGVGQALEGLQHLGGPGSDAARLFAHAGWHRRAGPPTTSRRRAR